jgi:hypothetical protein
MAKEWEGRDMTNSPVAQVEKEIFGQNGQTKDEPKIDVLGGEGRKTRVLRILFLAIVEKAK